MNTDELSRRLSERLAGCYLAQLGVGAGQTQLVLDRVGDGPTGVVALEGDVTVGSAAARTAAASPETVTALMPSLNADVSNVTLAATGELRISFGATSLVAHPDLEYESWSLDADDGTKVVCMAGGELAVWSS